MFSHSVKPRLNFSVLLLCVLLLAALLPSVLRLTDNAASTWVQACTPQGMQWVDSATGQTVDAPDGTSKALAMLDCPLCLVQQHSPGVDAQAEALPVAVAAWRSTHHILAAHTQPPMSDAQRALRPPPRAPPLA